MLPAPTPQVRQPTVDVSLLRDRVWACRVGCSERSTPLSQDGAPACQCAAPSFPPGLLDKWGSRQSEASQIPSQFPPANPSVHPSIVPDVILYKAVP